MLKEAGGAASQEKLSKLVSVNMASSAGDSSLYWTLIGVLTIFCQGVCAQKTPTIGFISPDVVADIGKIFYLPITTHTDKRIPNLSQIWVL